MILKVNPTRVNLLSMKRRLKSAVRGHKLLKDKRDGLMKVFMERIRETKALRAEVEQRYQDIARRYVRASSTMASEALFAAFLLPSAKIGFEAKRHVVMSVPLPVFTLKKEGSFFSYGLLETSGELDQAVAALDTLFPKLIRLAELEKAIENLADEIERTRRRASALENTMIPNLKDTVRFIRMRLEEQARDAVVSTMRIKAMIVAREESLRGSV